MLMLDEGLAKVTTELDLKDIRLTVRRKVQVAISGRVDVENDRRPLEPLFGRSCQTSRAACSVALARRQFHGQAGHCDLAHQPRHGQSARGVLAQTYRPLTFPRQPFH
jgi:hypothetical protein